jgi:hypothetical protein
VDRHDLTSLFDFAARFGYGYLTNKPLCFALLDLGPIPPIRVTTESQLPASSLLADGNDLFFDLGQPALQPQRSVIRARRRWAPRSTVADLASFANKLSAPMCERFECWVGDLRYENG